MGIVRGNCHPTCFSKIKEKARLSAQNSVCLTVLVVYSTIELQAFADTKRRGGAVRYIPAASV